MSKKITVLVSIVALAIISSSNSNAFFSFAEPEETTSSESSPPDDFSSSLAEGYQYPDSHSSYDMPYEDNPLSDGEIDPSTNYSSNQPSEENQLPSEEDLACTGHCSDPNKDSYHDFSLSSPEDRSGEYVIYGALNTLDLGNHSLASGRSSVTFGSRTKASGMDSAAFGFASSAEGITAFAAGSGARATKNYTVALGRGPNATGEASIAIGSFSGAHALKSYSIGNSAHTYGPHSFSIGNHISTYNSSVIGIGNHVSFNTEESINFGYSNPRRDDGHSIPSLFIAVGQQNDVTDDDGNISKARYVGHVGVGTTNPISAFQVNGQLTIQDGSEGNNKILVSDADGKASWKELGSLGGTGSTVDLSGILQRLDHLDKDVDHDIHGIVLNHQYINRVNGRLNNIESAKTFELDQNYNLVLGSELENGASIRTSTIIGKDSGKGISAVDEYGILSPQNNTIIGNRAGLQGNGTLSTVLVGDSTGAGAHLEFVTALGTSAGRSARGLRTVFVGWQSGLDSTSIDSTNIGHLSGHSSEGKENTFLGMNSGRSTKGSNNVFLGSQSGARVVNGTYTTNYTNNTLAIDSRASSSPLVYGKFDTTPDDDDLTGLFKINGNFEVTGAVLGSDEATEGQILTVDAGGKATWADAPTAPVVDTSALEAAIALNASSLNGVQTETDLKFNRINNYANRLNGTMSSLTEGQNILNNILVRNGTTTIGYKSLQNTAGNYYTAIGTKAGNNSTGDYNVFVGRHVGDSLSGSSNTLLGDLSGVFSTGDGNTAVGSSAAESLSGNYNSVFGLGAGVNSNGNNNILLGRSAGYGSKSNNSVFIGNYSGASVREDNRLHIHNTGTPRANETPLVYGEFDNRLFRINGDFEVNGAVLGSDTANNGQVLTVDANGGVVWAYPAVSNNNSYDDSVLQASIATVAADLLANTTQTNTNTANITTNTATNRSQDSSISSLNYKTQDLNASYIKASMGYRAGYSAAGYYHTYIGTYAGAYSKSPYGVSATKNTGIGHFAGRSSTGQKNTFIGVESGYNSRGSHNVFIGAESGKNFNAGDNKLVIQNNSATQPLIYGEFDGQAYDGKIDGLVKINGDLEVTGAIANSDEATNGQVLVAQDGKAVWQDAKTPDELEAKAIKLEILNAESLGECNESNAGSLKYVTVRRTFQQYYSSSGRLPSPVEYTVEKGEFAACAQGMKYSNYQNIATDYAWRAVYVTPYEDIHGVRD